MSSNTSTIPDTMLEAHIDTDTHVTLHEVPVPSITKPDQILIKVQATSCNPKDWKMPAGLLKTIANCPNSGDDIAGTVVAVGENVHMFKPGDRVAALHHLGAPGGSYAEYATAYDHTCFHIGNVGFEDASTVPMVLFMASIGLFGMLKLPMPWATKSERMETPVLVYGAAGAVGSAALRLTQLAGIHPVICIAGNGIDFVKSLIDESKGDAVVDYRQKKEDLVKGIKKALKGQELKYAFDCVSEKGKGSWDNICEVLHPHGKLTLVLPRHIDEIPQTIEQSTTMAGPLFEGFKNDGTHGKMGFEAPQEFGLCLSALIGRWLREGKWKFHPYKVVEGGLEGLESALKDLRSGKVSAMKFVVRIEDTPRLQSRSIG